MVRPRGIYAQFPGVERWRRKIGPLDSHYRRPGALARHSFIARLGRDNIDPHTQGGSNRQGLDASKTCDKTSCARRARYDEYGRGAGVSLVLPPNEISFALLTSRSLLRLYPFRRSLRRRYGCYRPVIDIRVRRPPLGFTRLLRASRSP
jgi:hypothetical protein